jgi:hypothetical protein
MFALRRGGGAEELGVEGVEDFKEGSFFAFPLGGAIS